MSIMLLRCKHAWLYLYQHVWIPNSEFWTLQHRFHSYFPTSYLSLSGWNFTIISINLDELMWVTFLTRKKAASVQCWELQPVATKGKGKKGKNPDMSDLPVWDLNSLQSFGRIMAAQQVAKDNIEDAKGVPVSLTPYICFFLPVFHFFLFSCYHLLFFCYFDKLTIVIAGLNVLLRQLEPLWHCFSPSSHTYHFE